MRSSFIAIVLTTSCGYSCFGFLLPSGINFRIARSSRQFASTPDADRQFNKSTSEKISRKFEQRLESSVAEENRLAIEGDEAAVSPALQLMIQEPIAEDETKLDVSIRTVESSSFSSLRQVIEDAKECAAILGDKDEAYTLPERSPLEKAATSISLAAFVGAGTYLFAASFGDLLGRFELVQDWRYVWPLVGFLYVADGVRALLSTEGGGILEGWWGIRGKSAAARIIQIMGGLGVVIGGAYDVFMPVWMTGPNVVTNAGIGQDGAALVFLWTAWYTNKNLQQQYASKYKGNDDALDFVFESLRHGPLLAQIILLAQLYKLGESSFDELFF
uniref:Uncharacterized protein n=1 Tax=Odontella aurita TaxID=265563 RepID=A0A7S4N8C6_9STRA|mmetsp:Transcript_52150/g.156536  ORF Transcript_52150/g.156536 Transcript_52150/m.156536 type:complete len:331 (+) Transcript_52150:170-1162(+)